MQLSNELWMHNASQAPELSSKLQSTVPRTLSGDSSTDPILTIASNLQTISIFSFATLIIYQSRHTVSKIEDRTCPRAAVQAADALCVLMSSQMQMGLLGRCCLTFTPVMASILLEETYAWSGRMPPPSDTFVVTFLSCTFRCRWSGDLGRPHFITPSLCLEFMRWVLAEA